MPHNLTNEKSTLVQITAWCRQATSHYLNQCWSSSMTPFGIIRPQWVKTPDKHHTASSWLQSTIGFPITVPTNFLNGRLPCYGHKSNSNQPCLHKICTITDSTYLVWGQEHFLCHQVISSRERFAEHKGVAVTLWKRRAWSKNANTVCVFLCFFKIISRAKC